jgi:hypothetical protein
MAEVFISYAREDKDFVQKLHNALAGLNRDTWVDWEGIPLTASDADKGRHWRQKLGYRVRHLRSWSGTRFGS